MADQTTTQHSNEGPRPETLLRAQILSVSGPLGSASGWMKFLAVLSIIGAAVSLLSVFVSIRTIWWTLPLSVLPLWYGILLYSAGTAAQKAAEWGRETDLETAMRKIGLYFRIAGIASLITLILSTLGLCTAMGGGIVA